MTASSNGWAGWFRHGGWLKKDRENDGGSKVLKFDGSKIIQKLAVFPFAFYYTCMIFFGLRMSVEKVNYHNLGGGDLSFLYLRPWPRGHPVYRQFYFYQLVPVLDFQFLEIPPPRSELLYYYFCWVVLIIMNLHLIEIL